MKKSNKWLLNLEKQRKVYRYVIRRWVVLKDGRRKLERYPTKKYLSIRNDYEELKKLVIRLNEKKTKEELTKNYVEIKHAFIDETLLESYRNYLEIQIPTKGKARNQFHYLKTYFLNFFISKLNLPNPLDWHLVHETEWAKYLVGPEVPKAASTKKEIVAAANRFMLWLHKRRPTEVPSLVFQPLTKAKYKEIEAVRNMEGNIKKRYFISDLDWKRIKESLPDSIAPFVLLSYHYGLRRAESLGVKNGDTKNSHISIERQLLSVSNSGEVKHGPPKGRAKREVPHWFCKASDCYSWIELSQKNLIHPDTLTDRWAEYMDKLGLKYDFHDLRHTFITKAIRLHSPRDVQLAAGHTDITTTMRYVHDDRDLKDDVFVPTAS